MVASVELCSKVFDLKIKKTSAAVLNVFGQAFKLVISFELIFVLV